MATSNPKRGRAASGRVLVVETPPEIEAETEEKTEAEHAAEEVLEETRAANPRGPEAIIYRLDPETGEEKWIARVASSLVSHEWLAKKYGGGKYRVQHRKPNATGKMVFGGQETYTIDASVRPELMTAPIMDGSPGGGSRIDAIMEAGVMSLIQQMQNANTTQMELVRSIVSERASAKSMDWVGVLGALAPIVTALIERTGEKKPDVMEQAKEIAELATKNQGAQGGIKDVLGAFREMLELRDLLGGGGDDNRSPGERLLEAAIPKFVELADRYAVTASAPQAPGRVVTPPVPSPQLNAGTPQPSTEPMWIGFVSRKIPAWVKLAQMDKDPALYAALEMDNMPPMFMGPLRQFLQRDDAVDLVLAAYPALKEYESWAREFFDEISTLVLGEDEEETDNGNEEEDDNGATGEASDDEARRSADGSGSLAESRAVEERGDSDESGITHASQRTPRRRNRARGGTD